MLIDQQANEIFPPNELRHVINDIHEGYTPDLDFTKLLNTFILQKDIKSRGATGRMIKLEIQSGATAGDIDAVVRTLFEMIDSEDELGTAILLEACIFLPYKKQTGLLKNLGSLLGNIIEGYKIPDSHIQAVLFDLLFRTYLQSVAHEESLDFTTSNILDSIRLVVSVLNKCLRQTLPEASSNKTQHVSFNIDVLNRIGEVFMYYLIGRLPDELAYSTSDQRDILRPLVAVLCDQVLQNIDCILKVAMQAEETIFVVLATLVANGLAVRYEQQEKGSAQQETILMAQELATRATARLETSYFVSQEFVTAQLSRDCLRLASTVIYNLHSFSQ